MAQHPRDACDHLVQIEIDGADHPLTCQAFSSVNDRTIPKSSLSQHFKVLREAGLIHQRHKGTTRLNTLRRDDLEARFPGLLDSILKAAGDPALAVAQAT